MFALLKLSPPPPKVQVPAKVRMLEKHGIDITLCLKCKTGIMQLLATYYGSVLSKSCDAETFGKAGIGPQGVCITVKQKNTWYAEDEFNDKPKAPTNDG